MQIYAFISPGKLATLLLVLLSNKGFSPGSETAARAVTISSMLTMSVDRVSMIVCSLWTIGSLTNEVGLPGLHVQDDEADQAGQRGNDTEREGEVDGGFVLSPHSGKKEEWKCVDYTT